MNTEETETRSDQRTVRGKVNGSGTLNAAAETLLQVFDRLQKIAHDNPAVMHSAKLTWQYDAGASFDVGRGLVTWELVTETME